MRAGLADSASPPVQAPDGGGARGGAAPRGPTAPAPAAGRAATAAAAAAAPGPALPAQLVPLRAAELAALGRGQQGGFRVRARFGGVSYACPAGRKLFRTEALRGARGPGLWVARPPPPWSCSSAAREEAPALSSPRGLLGHGRLPGQRGVLAPPAETQPFPPFSAWIVPRPLEPEGPTGRDLQYSSQ